MVIPNVLRQAKKRVKEAEKQGATVYYGMILTEQDWVRAGYDAHVYLYGFEAE